MPTDSMRQWHRAAVILTPTMDELSAFEDRMFNSYDALVREIMAQNGFDPTDIGRRSGRRRRNSARASEERLFVPK